MHYEKNRSMFQVPMEMIHFKGHGIGTAKEGAKNTAAYHLQFYSVDRRRFFCSPYDSVPILASVLICLAPISWRFDY